LNNLKIPNLKTSQSKNAKASPTKELQTIQQANPKNKTFHKRRIPNPTSSLSKIAKDFPTKELQTIHQANPK
jgi:hypothetical protein